MAMMLRQSSSRNLSASEGRRYKVKIKDVSQICLILAVSLWMLYQLRHCHFINKGIGLMRKDQAGSHKVAVTLGRKGLLPGLVVEDDDEDAKGTDKEAGRGAEFELVDDLMEETDEQVL